ncbi:MAG TPA: condensation domain-containing protein [Pseudonocardiaceae bacterium]
MTDESPASDAFAPGPPVTRRPAEMTELPLLPQQRRWLAIEDRHPGANTPLVTLVYRLRGQLDLAAWRAAVGAVVDRHEALRARFANRDGQDYQYFAPPSGLDLEYLDLSDLPADQRAPRARELFDERMRMPLKYADGPLVVSTVLRIGDDDHVWMLKIGHIVADGTSLVTVVADLAAAYNALVAGCQPDLPDVEIRYGDYLAWFAAQDPARFDDDLRYWVDRLDGVPSFEPPLAHPRPDRKGAPTGEVRQAITAGHYREAGVWGQRNRCSRYVVLVTAMQAMLHRWTGQVDFCIGLPVAGSERGNPSFEHIVGLFNRMVLLRCDLAGDPTFTELLRRTRDAVLDALDHQDLSFAQVVAAMGVPNVPSRAQLCQVLFLINEFQDSGDLKLTGLTVEDFPLTIPGMPYDLMVCALPADDGLSLRVFYDTGLFAEPVIATVIDDFDAILHFAVTHPESRLSELP